MEYKHCLGCRGDDRKAKAQLRLKLARSPIGIPSAKGNLESMCSLLLNGMDIALVDEME